MTEIKVTEVDDSDISNVLAANYMLASVHVRIWSAKKTDKAASDELTAQKGADSKAARVVKSLLVGSEAELKKAQSAYAGLRNFFYAWTMPWGASDAGRGDGLIGVKDAMKFMAEFARRKTDAEAAREALLAVYATRVTEAQAAQGGLYKAADYPSANDVRQMFGAVMTMRPVPTLGDFSRVNVPAALAKGLASRYASQAQDQVERAIGDVRDRLVQALERMHTQLSKVANAEKTKLYASLLTNMEHLCGLAESMAPVSTELGVVAKRIKSELLQWKIDAFKDNVTLSRAVANKASKIMEDLNPQHTATVIEAPVAEHEEEQQATIAFEEEQEGEEEQVAAIVQSELAAADNDQQEDIEIPDFTKLLGD